MTPIRLFICNGTSLRYLTLKRLGFRQGGGIAYANLFRETSEQEEMKFIFNTNKNKQSLSVIVIIKGFKSVKDGGIQGKKISCF